MTTAPTSEPSTETGRKPRRTVRWLWILALVAVIAVAGIVLWLVLSSNGDDQQTVTFDGDTLVYAGPAIFNTKVVTLQLENNSDKWMTFAWGLHTDPTITSADLVAWTETHSGEPPWLEMYYEIDLVAPGTVEERTVLFLEGSIGLVAWDAERTGRTYGAAVVEVAPE